MASTPSEGASPPPSPDFVSFSALMTSLPKYMKQPPAKFFKKLYDIPKIPVQRKSRNLALRFEKYRLIGKFTSIWPSPKSISPWIYKNLRPLIKGNLSQTLCRKGFFAFLFEEKAKKDIVFKSGPCFMGSRGLYLNRWTPDFSPKNDIPSAVPFWVRLPLLPLHCRNDETIRNIGNTMGKYIDRAYPKEGL
jgi:hypothetical protein